MEQLMVYEALFCLEYNYSPKDIDVELRIYQFDDIQISNPDPNDISVIMDKIVFFDEKLNRLKETRD